MSLQKLLSWDKIATADLANMRRCVALSGCAIGSGSGRRGTNGIVGTGAGNYQEFAIDASEGTVIVGAAYRHTLPSSREIFAFQNPSAVGGDECQVTVGVLSDGSIRAYHGTRLFGSTLGTSVAGVFSWDGSMHSIQAKVVCSDTGSVEVKVNGATVLTVSPADTKLGVDYITSVRFYLDQVGSCMDDGYICTGSGADGWTDFMGDIKVTALSPTADGDLDDFVPSTGSSHFALIDDPTPNDSDYNESDVLDDRDSFVVQTISADPIGVEAEIYCAKPDAGVAALAAVVRHSGVNYDGDDNYLGVDFKFQAGQAYGKHPSTSAWSQTNFNASQFGYKKTV